MAQASVTYLPVGNGDCSITRLRDDTTIVVDVNHREKCGDADKAPYDVHDHLKRESRKDDQGRRHHDVFALTHPDQDHCRGFDEIFFCGDPKNYDEKKHGDKIIVDELWFSPRVFSVHEYGQLSDDAKAFKKEADRRIKLHKQKDSRRDEPGNRIRIIGYTENGDFDDLKHITTGPGETLNEINGKKRDHFEVFIHAPFKRDTDSDDGDRNGTSIVFQARFAEGGDSRAGLVFQGGDSNCDVIEAIVDKSDDEDLAWDLLLAPHHASWTFFSNDSPDDGEPSEKVLSFLDKRRPGAQVISSSKTLADGKEAPPPHERAVEEYKKKVGDDNFLVTQEHPNEDKPEPIKFVITKTGPQKRESTTASAVVSSSSQYAAVSTPHTYG